MKKADKTKVSTRTKIYALLDRTVKPKDIAKQLNIPVQSVYSAKYLRWKEPKSKSKKTYQKTVSPKNNLKFDEISRITARVQLEDKVEAMNIEIANLKHQIIGFRAVISYLENLSGLKDSQ